ncbi:MAG: hypothetical protein LBS88_04915 [Tannerellaceae bacterium]|jgi:hypothetical protein|nr:hypothetical protein [Tannerellaceae bacterium]
MKTEKNNTVPRLNRQPEIICGHHLWNPGRRPGLGYTGLSALASVNTNQILTGLTGSRRFLCFEALHIEIQ